jgi:hypothetical protein
MCLHFGFVFFWQNYFGAKAAHKMLVKLTPGLIFAGKAGTCLSGAPYGPLMVVRLLVFWVILNKDEFQWHWQTL